MVWNCKQRWCGAGSGAEDRRSCDHSDLREIAATELSQGRVIAPYSIQLASHGLHGFDNLLPHFSVLHVATSGYMRRKEGVPVLLALRKTQKRADLKQITTRSPASA